MTSHLTRFLIILVFVGIPVVFPYLQWDTKKEDGCSNHNGSCTDCISASQLNQTLICYFCGNSCMTVDHKSILTSPKCSLNDLYVGQCDLNLISLIFVVAFSVLCFCFTCCTTLVVICCCCCCFQKRKSEPKPIARPNYTRLINRDSFERQKMREEKRREIRERYEI